MSEDKFELKVMLNGKEYFASMNIPNGQSLLSAYKEFDLMLRQYLFLQIIKARKDNVVYPLAK